MSRRPDNGTQVLTFYDGGHGADAQPTSDRGFMGWLARRDLNALLSLLDPRPGLTVLDAGCGVGVHARMLSQRGLKVCAVDFSPRMVEAVRPHVDEALLADLDELSLGRKFDRILSWGTLEFVRDPECCLQALADHLSEGGRMVLMVPRRSLGGFAYHLWHRVKNNIDTHLFTARRLQAAARRSGLRLVGRRDPFVHCMALAWTRPRSLGEKEKKAHLTDGALG